MVCVISLLLSLLYKHTSTALAQSLTAHALAKVLASLLVSMQIQTLEVVKLPHHAPH